MTIIVHYGGEWKQKPDLEYVGESCRIFDEIPSDFNADGMRKIIDSLGYKDIVKLHYCDPCKSIKTGLQFLSYDNATFAKFLSLLIHYRMMNVYTEHHDDEEDGSDERVVSEGRISMDWLGNDENDEGVLRGDKSFLNWLGNNKSETMRNLFGVDNETGEGREHVSYKCYNVNQNIESQVVVHLGNEDDIDYDEEGSDHDDDEVRGAREEIKLHNNKEKDLENELLNIRRQSTMCDDPLTDAEDGSGSDIDSFPESPLNSDTEEGIGNLVPDSPEKRKRNVATHSRHMLTLRVDDGSHFFVGQQFEDAKELRKAITNYCVSQGRDVVLTKNGKKKMGAKCRAHDRGCPWWIWASSDSEHGTMVVKTLVPKHICGRIPNVRLRSKWIVEHYHNKFRVNPYLKCQEIVDTIWSDFGIKVSAWHALKARREAQQLILGEYKHQYSMLNRYAAEITKANPHNTVKFGLNQGQFQRVYICFDSIKKGFLAGCRPFFGIDGCFLKGPFGGQLLIAVGRDGNNQMFPIAWACVEVEDTHTWEWFLELLAVDLGTMDSQGYTIMSDQQKGLLKAISNVWPRAETRCCARHVYCNFRTKFGGGLLYRRGFWKVAKSTTENDFNANMELFSNLNAEAGKDLLNRNYKKWVRAFQTPQSKCGSIDNNMNEVFNTYILSSRHKPIITMLEDIREGLMEKMHKKRDYVADKDILICPRIQKALEYSKVAARGWVAYWDGNFTYGVREGGTQVRYVVSLLDKTCSYSTVNGAGAGVVLVSQEGDTIEYALKFLFKATNNEAEYEAAIAGLPLCLSMGAKKVHLTTDSQLVANQFRGEYEVRENVLAE
ncbi:Protein FAR1-RELATED SEQUENCE 6 [Bienertia sinuspersici]